MPIARDVLEAGGQAPPATRKVWDPFVRLFHWSLVGLFVAAYATGDENDALHIRLGYAIAVLLALRVAWGFVGTRHARFADFVRSPHEIAAYLRAILAGRAERHIGHNPAGGAMILALIAMLTGTCVTGIMMTTTRFWGSELIEEVHEVLAAATVGLILLHVAGVVMASLAHRENLAKAMITGRKPE